MKRLLIATLVLACLALTQGNLVAGLIGLDQPAATTMNDGCADPNGPGNE
jgi:hypothetical protein